MTAPFGPRPAPSIEGTRPYSVPRPRCPVDLLLDGNEGLGPPAALLQSLQTQGPELMRRYPDEGVLQQVLASRYGLQPDQVLVTAGVDDALDRLCRALLTAGREMIMPRPSFEMLERYARIAGAEVRHVPWPGEHFPIGEYLARITPQTALVCLVSPNNPTGAVAKAEHVKVLAQAAPQAVVLVDHAYVEFADEDLTQVALQHPNCLVVRTLSKAWGMAGLRVGFALGPSHVMGWMRAAGAPYPVAGPSLLLAAERVRTGEAEVQSFVTEVRRERASLQALLTELGAAVVPSQANFVFVRTPKAAWWRDALAGLGIAVRVFPGKPGLEDSLRITCPGEESLFERLQAALLAVARPQALLLDLDGVLADVTGSYRKAIVQTAALFGVHITAGQIARAKEQGNANNDWILTHRLLAQSGVHVSLAEVTEQFERLYQGTEQTPGLRATERLIPTVELIQRLSQRLPLVIVTGRPRADARAFLRRWALEPLVRAVVCMEDGPGKPDPAPVRMALRLADASRAWMVGDTPDDMRAARAAGVVAIGVTAPGDDAGWAEHVLSQAGAGRVLGALQDLEELLP